MSDMKAVTKRSDRGSLRFSKEDQAILAALEKKLGLNTSSVLRLALRRMHDLEMKKAS